MLQIAVFVDAGYLHAQGSALLAGSAQRRELNRLDVPAVLACLSAEAAMAEPAARLLRIYWYDGVARGGLLNVEQRALARSDNVKCRFGTINSRGQQKGVDSLIVTDLVQLAREKAMSDALILAGDEDLRVGVQIAQTFGIRVHLLGIQPASGSQSPDLLAEADTTREWGRNEVGKWLSVVDFAEPLTAQNAMATASPSSIETLALTRVAMLDPAEAMTVLRYAQANRNRLPPEFDRPTLGLAREALGRELTLEERARFRTALLDALRQKLEL